MHRRIVLLGPPAAGKGTQAELMKRAFGWENPSVGAMLREQKAQGTPVGLQAAAYFDEGRLVPDVITIEVVRNWMGQREGGWIMDGFPRTVAQCEAFDAMLNERGGKLDLAILLNLDETAVRERVKRRLVCLECGGVFSLGLHVQAASEPCPSCAAQLARRTDDEPESVSRRLAEYRERTEPVVPHYRGKGLLCEIDAAQTPAAVFASIAAALSAS